MKTEDKLPQEVQCFVCLKSLVDYKIAQMCVRCKDMDVLIFVALCDEDVKWLKENPDAGTAICQSRLSAIVEREDKNADS